MQRQASPQQQPMRVPLTDQQEKLYRANLPDQHPVPPFVHPGQDTLDIASQEYLELEEAAWNYALGGLVEDLTADTYMDTQAPPDTNIAPAETPAATMAEQPAGSKTMAAPVEPSPAAMAEQSAGSKAETPMPAAPVEPSLAAMAEQSAGSNTEPPMPAAPVEPSPAAMTEQPAGSKSTAAVAPPPAAMTEQPAGSKAIAAAVAPPPAAMTEQPAGSKAIAAAVAPPPAAMTEQQAGNTAVVPMAAALVEPLPDAAAAAVEQPPAPVKPSPDAVMAEPTPANTAVAPAAAPVEPSPGAVMATPTANTAVAPAAAPVEPSPDAVMATPTANTAVAPAAAPVEPSPDAVMAEPTANTAVAPAAAPKAHPPVPTPIPVALKQSLAAQPKAVESAPIKFTPVTPAAARTWMALLKRTSTDDLSATTSPAPAPATPMLAPSTPPPAPVSFAQQLMKMDDVQLQSGNARVANTIVPTPQSSIVDAIPKSGSGGTPSPPIPEPTAPGPVDSRGDASVTSQSHAPTDEVDVEDKKTARATYMRYYRSVRSPKVPSAVAIKFREAMSDVSGKKGRELFEAYIESGENWLSSSIVLSDSQSHDETEGGRWSWLTRDESWLYFKMINPKLFQNT